MSKKIKFIPNSQFIDDCIDPPVPARKMIPEWYKKSTRFYKGNEYELKDKEENFMDIKSCIPFFDSLNSGYIQKLWFDIYIESDDTNAELHCRIDDNKIINRRPDTSSKHFPTPYWCAKSKFTFLYPYSVLTPPGYSTIFTQPFNQFESPLLFLTGVVDTDVLIQNGNYPFFVRKNFKGVVKAGTPIIQMIPFKRESWKSSKDSFENNSLDLNRIKLRVAEVYGYYKNNIWNRKEYL